MNLKNSSTFPALFCLVITGPCSLEGSIPQSRFMHPVRALTTAHSSTPAPLVNSKQFPHLAHFLEQQSKLPSDAKETLQTYSHSLPNMDTKKSILKLSGKEKCYYLKIVRNALYRLLYAHRITQCIQKHGIQNIEVTKKYFTPLQGKWALLAESAGDILTPLNRELLKGLTTIVEETGIYDLHGENIRTHNGKLVLIDTELCTTNKSIALTNLDASEPLMNEEARAWLKKRLWINRFETSTLGQHFCTYNSQIDATQYDPFPNAHSQIKQYLKQHITS